MVKLKRAYEKAERKDGHRVLVDRLWPRGIKKEDLDYDDWPKDLAPSKELRQYFGHEPSKWKTFRTRYKAELRKKKVKEIIHSLAKKAQKKTVTLLYSAKNEEYNDAVVLKEIIENEIKKISKLGEVQNE